MDNTATTITTMSLQAFMQRFDRDGAFELIDGKIVPVPLATNVGRTYTGANLHWLVSQYARPRNLGRLLSNMPYVLTRRDKWVVGSRLPDALFITIDRLTAYQFEYPEWQSKPLLLVPDLTVEIVSPDDRYVEIEQRVDLYRADGVRLVWVINARAQTVTVTSAGGLQRLSADDTLDGGDVIPGFQARVGDLFV